MTAFVDALIELFNRRSMDLPDGYFSRHTQLLLNGVPFEQMLGRPPNDPLILMLARGPAGYRFAAKAVQHAIPDGRIQRGELRHDEHEGGAVVSGQAWLAGHYRGAHEPAEVLIGFEITASGQSIVRMAATVSAVDLDRLRAARLAS